MSYEFQPLSGGIDYVQPSEPTPEADSTWAKINGDTKYDYDATNSTGLTENWRHTLHGTEAMCVKESNDVVFSGGYDGTLYAVNKSNGDYIWSHTHHGGRINDLDVNGGIVFSVSIAGDKVIASNTSDGSKIWEHTLHTNNPNAVIATDNYVISGGSTTYAVNPSDGSEIWNNSFTNSSECLVADGDYLYVGSDGTTSYVEQVNISDGTTTSKSHTLNDNNIFAIGTSTDYVFSGDTSGNVVCVDKQYFTEEWTHTLHSNTVRSIQSINNVVYSTGYNGEFFCVDIPNGNQIWSKNFDTSSTLELDSTHLQIYVADKSPAVISNDINIDDEYVTQTFTPTDWQLKVSDGNGWWDV